MRVLMDPAQIEKLMQEPGDLKLLFTVQFLAKNGQVLVETVQSTVPRRTIKKLLRQASLALPLLRGEDQASPE